MNDPTTTPEMKLTILQDGAYAYSGMGLDEFEITEMTAGNSKTLSSDIREHCEYLEMKLKENFRKDTKAETNAQIARLAKLGYDVTGICNWVNGERYALAEAAEERRLAEEAANNPNNFSSSLTMLNREGRAESNKQAKDREKNRQKWDGKTINYAGFGAISDEDLYQGLKVVGGFLKDNVVDPIGEKAAEYVGGKEFNFQTVVGLDLELTVSLPTGLSKKAMYANLIGNYNNELSYINSAISDAKSQNNQTKLNSLLKYKDEVVLNKQNAMENFNNVDILETHTLGASHGVNLFTNHHIKLGKDNIFDMSYENNSKIVGVFTNKTGHFESDKNQSNLDNLKNLENGRIGLGITAGPGITIGFAKYNNLDDAIKGFESEVLTEFNSPLPVTAGKNNFKQKALNLLSKADGISYSSSVTSNSWKYYSCKPGIGLEYAKHKDTFTSDSKKYNYYENKFKKFLKTGELE